MQKCFCLVPWLRLHGSEEISQSKKLCFLRNTGKFRVIRSELRCVPKHTGTSIILGFRKKTSFLVKVFNDVEGLLNCPAGNPTEFLFCMFFLKC